MLELNGFKIEKFNQYDLPENVKTHTCPLCSNGRHNNPKQKCLMIDWTRGLATCQHCGMVIQLHTYRKKENIKQYKRPEWNNKTELSDKIVKWFEGRKISQNTLKLAKITESNDWMPQFNKEILTINFNYFRDNELINIKYRGANKSFKMFKDAEMIFYNLDLIRNFKECIIVEGEIDCLSFIEVGLFNCVSVPNGSTLKNVNLEYLDNCYEYFENKEKIYLALDNDEPGQNVQKELIRRLGSERCYTIDFEGCKDANEYLIKFGGERLRQTIDNAKIVPISNVTTCNDHLTELYDYYEHGLKRGYGIGIDSFDSIFSTYLKQFIVITGIPSHGKSDFVDQMAVGYCFNNDWKGAFCSIENEPRYLHIDKILRKITGLRPDDLRILETHGWQKAIEKLNEYFFFIDFSDGYDLKKVLNKIAELVKRKGIKYFVIDPYNKIKLKESLKKDVNAYTSDYLYEIDSFCRQYDVLGLIIAHPIKMGKINGIYEKPGFYDIKGGGEWYDMSPHGLLVYKDDVNERVLIEVLKCKFQNLGKNGAEVLFKWNTKNGRYTPIIDNDYSFNYDNLVLRLNGNKLEFKEKTIYELNEEPLPF